VRCNLSLKYTVIKLDANNITNEVGNILDVIGSNTKVLSLVPAAVAESFHKVAA
jgi:hypothetical protein